MFKIYENLRKEGSLITVIVLSVAVFFGQLFEARGANLDSLPDTLRLFIDQTQYEVGLLLISFIFIIAAIKKYEEQPNAILKTLKWYFTILFFNDFFVLLLRTVQKSNVVTLQNGFTGIGEFYLILASVRSISDLLLTSIAACILIRGLVKYRFSGEERPADSKLGTVITGLIIFKVVASIPVSLTGVLTNRTLFVWSLGVSQILQLAVAALFYWVVKEQQQYYKIKFLGRLTGYFGINFLVAGLNFTYSMGSYSLLQRLPAGEIETLGGYGKMVLFVSMLAHVLMNYFMYSAIDGYNEGEAITPGEKIDVEGTGASIAGES